MTAVAARAIVAIDSDDPGIGTVAAVFIGMGDVSSCVIEVVPGQRVDKGEEIGYSSSAARPAAWCSSRA
jgi:phosphatidylserine decarboxylase